MATAHFVIVTRARFKSARRQSCIVLTTLRAPVAVLQSLSGSSVYTLQLIYIFKALQKFPQLFSPAGFLSVVSLAGHFQNKTAMSCCCNLARFCFIMLMKWDRDVWEKGVATLVVQETVLVRASKVNAEGARLRM